MESKGFSGATPATDTVDAPAVTPSPETDADRVRADVDALTTVEQVPPLMAAP